MKERNAMQILCTEVGFLYTSKMDSLHAILKTVDCLIDEIEGMVPVIDIALGDFSKVRNKRVDHISISPLVNRQFEALRGITKAKSVEQLNQKLTRVDTINLFGPYEREHAASSLLSDCFYSIVFAIESPCKSRHIAECANRVWRQKYGVTLFDQYSGQWFDSWMQDKLRVVMGDL